MDIEIKLDKGAKMPTRAHTSDAGFDLYSPAPFIVLANRSAIIDTGVHMNIPDNYVGFLKSKSGLNVKKGIVSEGVIDAGYTGSIVVKLYNHSNLPYAFEKGDKISQIVILPVQTPFCELKEVSEFKETERGDNGFGSSGK